MTAGFKADRSAKYCDDQRRPRPNGQQSIHYSGPNETCDLCQQPVVGQQYFADCALNGSDQWGIVCQDCIAVNRFKFGWGTGQLYAREADEDARWLLVAGYPGSGGDD